MHLTLAALPVAGLLLAPLPLLAMAAGAETPAGTCATYTEV